MRRYYEPGMVYSVTSVTKERFKLFRDILACRFLTTCFQYQKFVLSFKLYGFVIMPDHFHLVIQPPPDVSISVIIKHIKGNFARKYNWMKNNEGTLWQRRFYDRGLRGMPQLLRELTYIHYNPVRAGLAHSPGDYEFSSYNYFFGNAYRDLIDRAA